MKRIICLVMLVIAVLSCQKEQPKPSSIQIEGTTEYSLAQQATMLVIKVSGPSDWTYDFGEGSSWMSEKSKSEDKLEVNVQANSDQNPRTAVITFKAGSSSATVKVTQKGSPFDPVISVSPSGTTNVPCEGGTKEFVVDTNMDSWEAVSKDAWISVRQDGNTLYLDIEANPIEDVRDATIDVVGTCSLGQEHAFVKIHQDEKVVEYDPENLSADGTSNCYLLTHRGEYSFNATVKGNGKSSEGLSAPSMISPASAKLIWQSEKNMIKSVSLKDGVISFVVNRVYGNALIGAYDASGNIIWSWHIWFPHEAVSSLKNPYGEEMMNYNLGAIDSTPASVTSYGLLYQWGRKDPFPGSPRAKDGDISLKNADVYDINGNIVAITHVNALEAPITTSGMSHLNYAIAHPTVAIGNKVQYVSGCRSWLPASECNVALWGNPDGDKRESGEYENIGTKSYFDPCPKGWRLPPMRSYSHLTKTGGMAWGTGTTENLGWGDLGGATTTQIVDLNGDGKLSLDDDWRCGWNFYIDVAGKKHSYFPATTRYDGQYAMLMGSMVGVWGNYWTNTSVSDNSGKDGLSQAMSFGLRDYNSDKYTPTLSPVSAGSQADAYAVRCIKE